MIHYICNLMLCRWSEDWTTAPSPRLQQLWRCQILTRLSLQRCDRPPWTPWCHHTSMSFYSKWTSRVMSFRCSRERLPSLQGQVSKLRFLCTKRMSDCCRQGIAVAVRSCTSWRAWGTSIVGRKARTDIAGRLTLELNLTIRQQQLPSGCSKREQALQIHG